MERERQERERAERERMERERMERERIERERAERERMERERLERERLENERLARERAAAAAPPPAPAGKTLCLGFSSCSANVCRVAFDFDTYCFLFGLIWFWSSGGFVRLFE